MKKFFVSFFSFLFATKEQKTLKKKTKKNPKIQKGTKIFWLLFFRLLFFGRKRILKKLEKSKKVKKDFRFFFPFLFASKEQKTLTKTKKTKQNQKIQK